MTKTSTRIISLLLAAVLTAAGLAVIAFAAENETVLFGNAGENVTWTLTGDGLLTVRGTGPIEDETEAEYDEDGYACTSTLDSIGMTVARCYDTLTEGLGAAEAARVRFDLVKEIVIEEGITEIPYDEFSGMYPRKVTLPSTLETLSYSVFDLLFAEEIVVNSVKLDHLEIYVPAYMSDAEPYGSLDEAREDYIETAAAREAFDFELLPFDALCTYAYVVMLPDEAGWLQMDEDAKQEMMDLYNQYLGTDETELEALVPAALAKLNELFSTAYENIEEIFTVATDEDGCQWLENDPRLQEIFDAKNDELYNDARLTIKALDTEDEFRIAYGWFTVTAPAGGRIEADCTLNGVNFRALEGLTVPAEEAEEENENLCKFCGKDYSGNLWQKFVGFLHKILYFFAHLFGKM